VPTVARPGTTGERRGTGIGRAGDGEPENELDDARAGTWDEAMKLPPAARRGGTGRVTADEEAELRFEPPERLPPVLVESTELNDEDADEPDVSSSVSASPAPAAAAAAAA
jgi:hypothetical protein